MINVGIIGCGFVGGAPLNRSSLPCIALRFQKYCTATTKA